MKHRRFLFIVFSIAAVVCEISNAQTAHSDTSVDKLVIPIFFEAEIPRDIGRISEEADRITRMKAGVSVELIPLLFIYGLRSDTSPDPRRISELEMLRKQGIRFDVLPDVLPGTTFIAIDDLAGRFGQDILHMIGDYRLNYSRVNGRLFKLPSICDYAASAGVAMRKDIVDKYAIDLSAISSISDLNSVFALVSEKEPNMKMVCPYQTREGFLARMKFKDEIPASVCSVSPDDETKIVNWHATGQYRKDMELFRKWYELGYLPDNMPFQNIRASQMVKAGELFSYFCAYKPGIDYEESGSCGREMITVPLMEPLITRRSLDLVHWGISDTCENPDKAMQFLNLLYTDGELANLLIYGVEGVHYVRGGDGTIEYPEGIDAENVGYENTLPWLMPNQEITYVRHGNDPLLWERLREFNRSAVVADTLDFEFDESGVKARNDALNLIADRYLYGLETGQLNPAVYLPEMLGEMEAAGVEFVLKEVQSQYDKFRERKGTSR